MNEKANLKASNLPASAVFLIIFLIVTWVLTLVFGALSLLAPLWYVVIIIWFAKLLFDLVCWLRADQGTRAKMLFPRKTVGLLFIIILAVGYLGYLIASDMGYS